MGLRLKRGNDQKNNSEGTLSARNKDFEGVKKEGGAVGPYGEKSYDLGLGLFDGNQEDNRPKDGEQDKVELKLYSDEDPNDVFRLGQKDENEGGLRLSGQKDSAKKKGTTGDMNPWDHPYEEYAMGSRSISKPIDSRTYNRNVEEEHHPVLLISFVVVIVLFAIELTTLGWVSSRNTVDVQFNLMKFQWIYGVVPIVVFVDVILVNVLYKKNIPLIIFAMILPFLYPLQRGKYTNGHSISGLLVCWGSLIAYISVILIISEAVSSYGVIVQMPDSEIRHEAATVLDQDIRGIKASSRIMPNMTLETAIYEQVDGEETVYLMGKDSIYVSGNSFITAQIDNVDTVLGFTKNGVGQYELTFVSFDEQELDKALFQTYWDEVLGS